MSQHIVVQPQQLSFIQLRMLDEIRLRGHVMMLSADLELLLLKIILACLADTPNEVARKFKSLPLEAKIAMLKHDLKIHGNEYYKKYIGSINKLDKIKNFRNKFAHCKIEWDNKDISYFKILIISDVKGKEKPSLIKMTHTEFAKKTEQIRQILLDLVELYKEMEDEFNKKYPNFFNPK